ncbi:hypothetical protein DFJ74DRAFT_667132 [Hyaloraphidium curvatum]|nr:hypothetical protein DFJ74DRAFT_667132 [Hyaloraphidium curvatum]
MAESDVPTGIGDLPFELLAKILSALAPGLPSLYKLSRVSKRWRAAVLTTPSLWREIDFYRSQETDNTKIDRVDDAVILRMLDDDRVARTACERLVLDYSGITRQSLDRILDSMTSLSVLSCHGCAEISYSEDELRDLFASRTAFGKDPNYTGSVHATKPVSGPERACINSIGLIGIKISSQEFEGPLSLSRLSGRVLLLAVFFQNPFRTSLLPPYLGFPMCERCVVDRRLVLTFSAEQTRCRNCGRSQHLCLQHVNKARCTACLCRLFCSWCRPEAAIWEVLGGSGLRCEDCARSITSPSNLSPLLDGLKENE